MRHYDREAFALAYVDALSSEVPGMDGERAGYAPALFAYREALLGGLQRLFGIDFDDISGPTGPLLMLFRATARSYLAITTPGDDFLEGGLLVDRLAEFGIAGDVLGDLESLQAGNAESRAIHLRVLTTLLGAVLGADADRVVTEKQLRDIDVDPTPPDPNDYGF
ncbi:MAG TPA: hypothetical protein VHZ97_09880 [Pseudonocardiaceae bacterium]|jgi:hypothetical protein|nr:hypothetical protein [Pseudonocardiaceae bacterium]